MVEVQTDLLEQVCLRGDKATGFLPGAPRPYKDGVSFSLFPVTLALLLALC